jgi:hypothetical protein
MIYSVRVGILLWYGKHLHHRIISVKKEFWTHKTSLSPQLFCIKSGGSEVMYLCATDFASFCDFSIGYKNYSVSVIFFCFHFINRTSNIWHTITKTFDVKVKLSPYNFINLTFSSSSKCFSLSNSLTVYYNTHKDDCGPSLAV